MEYYLIYSIQYPSKIFSVVPVSLNGIENPLIEYGLDLRIIEDIPCFEAGINKEFEVELTTGTRSFYKIAQLSKIEALSLTERYKKQQ